MPLPPLRRAAARLGLLGFSLLVGLFVAELAVRLLRPQPVMLVSRGLYAPDPPRRYRLQPGFRGTVSNRVEFNTRFSINRQGLRGPEIGAKRSGSLRILALGDSFTFGVGAREGETYPARLQEILRSRGVRSEVLNAGAPGFGVPDEVAWFQRWGWTLEPDVVLVTVFVGNDLQDASPGGPPVRVVDGALVVGGEGRSVSRWLYYHSHLFVLLKTSALGVPLRRLLGLPEPLETRELRAEFELYEKHGASTVIRQGLAASDQAVAGLARSTGGARALAVLIPSLIQVDSSRWRAGLKRFGLDPARFDPMRPNALLQEIFTRHGVTVLDLTETFAASIRHGQRVYYPIDQHLTPAGYRLVAETVADALVRTNRAAMRGE